MKFVIIIELIPSGEFSFEYFDTLIEVANRVPELKTHDDIDSITIALVLEEVKW